MDWLGYGWIPIERKKRETGIPRDLGRWSGLLWVGEVIGNVGGSAAAAAQYTSSKEVSR